VLHNFLLDEQDKWELSEAERKKVERRNTKAYESLKHTLYAQEMSAHETNEARLGYEKRAYLMRYLQEHDYFLSQSDEDDSEESEWSDE